ncbi:SOS response-associated peptidase [Demetria terragena]|uniref:SOS response-associated peptidase n=1 Tax=Demetria terragena TaxID=63959 RepID=UPI0004754277|nr:SOS response-associated peptidase [Demetria terragena]
MCGRYASSADPGDLMAEFDIDEEHLADPGRSILKNPQEPPPGAPDYNMAPTKQAPVVLTRAPRDDRSAAPTRQLRLLTWGLVPGWAKDVKVGLRMINARSETLLEKGAFAKAATARRCLVPADGWYEWQVSPTAVDAKGKPRKQPFFIHRADETPLAFAGLYEFWRDATRGDDDPGAWLTTFTIATRAAEPGLDRIHDRQPVVLDPDQWDSWLDPSVTAAHDVRALLEDQPTGRFEAWPVSRAVGGGRAQGAGLLEPVPAGDLVGVVDPMTGEVIGGE